MSDNMIKPSRSKQFFQQGLTLIEVSLALVFSAIIIASTVFYIKSLNESKVLRSEAEKLLELSIAAEGYAKSRQRQLLSSLPPIGISVNNFKNIGINELKESGFLRSNFPNTLGKNNQQFEVRLQHVQTSTMEAEDRNFRKLVIWTFTRNGEPYTINQVSELTKTLGSDAGYTSSDGSQIQGIGASWQVANGINLRPGHPVLRVSISQLNAAQNKKWTWIDVKGSRHNERQYRNASGEPMMISIANNNPHSFLSYSKCAFVFTGIEANLKRSHSNCAIMNGGGHSRSSFFLVEAKKSYSFAGPGTPMHWYEYRPVTQ
ncbi:TPA: type II secretion system protein J [Enterobacter asburiae]